jgi:isocitrate lyase
MSFTRLSDEDGWFEERVKQTEEWFSSPRFANIKRPYTAASVVEKRGTLPIVYPCDHQARKLWELLQKYAAAKKPLMTMGAIDPVQMTQMAPHQEVLYVSGWACSSVLVSGITCLILLIVGNEVGPDLGDYAYTTVPNQVHRMFKAQQLHDKKQYLERRQLSAEERAKKPYIDYMRPIVADADTGHGGLGTVMKLAKLFAESVHAEIVLD